MRQREQLKAFGGQFFIKDLDKFEVEDFAFMDLKILKMSEPCNLMYQHQIKLQQCLTTKL